MSEVVPGTTPAEVFLAARSAMERQSWEQFFPCLVRKDLERLAGMAVALVHDDPDGAWRGMLADHGVTADAVDGVVAAGEAITASALTQRDPALTPAERVELSAGHSWLVKAHDVATRRCVEQVADVAAFVAAVERTRRGRIGGGFVSSSMFVGDVLEEVVVDGSKAIGRRRGASSDPVVFRLERGAWRVSVFARA